MKLTLNILVIAISVVQAATFQNLVEKSLNISYDYVIVGGGTAGMTLASRLSTDKSLTVLVIEAGIPDNYEGAVMIPRFYPGASGFAPGTRYDWNLTSTPQEFLSKQIINLTQGHTIGGSSTVNAMIFDRGMPSNYDAWAALGNQGWNFAGLLPYFKKSECFTAATPANFATYGMTFDAACHGFEGPVQSSYLAWSHPNNSKLIPHSTPVDQGCNPLGAYLTTHSIDPRNQSRSSARTAHYDQNVDRVNLDILTGHQVTKLLFNTDGEKPRATGVEFSAGPGLPVTKVEVLKEVIVSAGALNTPKLLQLSGIGPVSLTSGHGIPSLVNLPGVGANLQDHPFGLTLASLSAGIPGNYELENATFDAEQKDLYYSKREGRWTDTIAEALAFIPLTNFTQSDVTDELLSIISSAGAAQYLPQDTDQTVKDGYLKQVQQLLEMHQNGSTAGMELLYVDGGRSIVNILMHPLSRGTVAINSTDPWAPPVIDPRYLSHPYDGRVLVESIRFNRKLMATEQIQALGATETLPGVGTTSDDDLLQFIKGVSSTEYHYTGTCAMLPRSLGGVVDSNLNVHGVDDLRIVDASIMPLLPSAHTQATVYAIAEKVNRAPTLDQSTMNETSAVAPVLTNFSNTGSRHYLTAKFLMQMERSWIRRGLYKK
ncbi:choline dehydrogenase [Colletotrichum godetiae]|uniref:Choline dehydrogenase n=1 Tax=Colletotrichum godetiae TaxID=1209918 RepID=A0AAJ0AKJ7_9PEZI|nr:choline dehydrogenase [Colletotrichum godetiae]KAK1675582.1 choline dehydrogenase [Colletotrichum godetiae]